MLAGFRSRWITPYLVGVIDRLADLTEQSQDAGHVELAGASVFGQPLAANVLHRVIEAALRHAAVVDRHDVGVAQTAEQFDLALEAALALRTGERPFEQDFQSDFAFGGLLNGLIDDALAAAVQLAQELVALDGVGGSKRVRGGWLKRAGRSWGATCKSGATAQAEAAAFRDFQGTGRTAVHEAQPQDASGGTISSRMITRVEGTRNDSRRSFN
jgi:hypothetical protein